MLLGTGRIALKRLMVFALALLPATPILALDVLQSELQVSFRHDGEDYVRNDRFVPLLPDNACYTWYVRADAPDTTLQVVERFTLPAPIDWGTQSPETVIEDGGRIAVTTSEMPTDGLGWFSHGWCAAEGDPTGPHLIEVSVDGKALASFPFEVIAPVSYYFPQRTVPERAARTANNFW